MMTRWHDINRLFNTISFLSDSLERFPAGFDPSSRWTSDWQLDSTTPRTNLYDNGENFAVLAEVPGVAKEDITVKIQGNYLEISGIRKNTAPEGYSVHRSERKEITFTRSFTLPAEIEADKVEARLENGILTLTLPKAAAAKPRQITIG